MQLASPYFVLCSGDTNSRSLWAWGDFQMWDFSFSAYDTFDELTCAQSSEGQSAFIEGDC